MYEALDIARYFISKDVDAKIFTRKKCGYNIKNQPYEGNLLLNKLLHTAQAIYIAKYGVKLFNDTLYAFENGPVIESVRIKYFQLLKNRVKYANTHISPDIDHLLDQIYEIYHDLTPEEFIEISHYDTAWEQAIINKDTQIMDMTKYQDEYKLLYSGALYLMDLMDRGVA